MKEQVNFGDFLDRFKTHDRDNQFTYDGKKALFEYLEQYEEDCDTEIELDVIALCCEYSEYENFAEFRAEYGDDYESLEKLHDHTTVIEFGNDSFIIQDF